MDTPSGLIDLRACKVHVTKTLPPEHPFRLALLQEPDFLPRPSGVAKLETYLRLAMALRGAPKA